MTHEEVPWVSSSGADGRRIFTVEFTREVIQQILKGEKTGSVSIGPSTWPFRPP